MWDIICLQNIYRQTYKTASGQSGWDGSVGHLDGDDASQCLRYSNKIKLIWSGEIKQMKEGHMWIYVGYYMST